MTTEAWTRHLRPSLAGLEPYHAPPVTARARLHANECPEPWPEEVMDAVAEAVRALELGRYPDASGAPVRRLLAARHDCDPDRVILGNGSDEIISTLLTALAGPPEDPATVVTPRPTFVMYSHSATVLGLRVREVPLTAALELDPAGMRAALADGPALCFLARPNNPTSSLWDGDLIRALIAEHPATVFVVDEAYADYTPGCTLWRGDVPDNHVHMGTLSKVGLAALRLGYCVAPPRLARALNVVRHPYNISQTTLAIAETILARFPDAQRAMIERTIQGRDRLARLLATLPGATVLPAYANIVVARLAPGCSAPRLRAALARRGVWIKDVSRLPLLERCVRASVGTDAELDLLERVLGDLDPGEWSE